jgi:hypothetical protein
MSQRNMWILATAAFAAAFYLALVPKGKVTYYSNVEVIGRVPEKPGVTTYGCVVGGVWALVKGRAEPWHFCRPDENERPGSGG